MRLSVPTEIFEGITYGCKRLDTTEEGNGLVHWMSINLATPDIELYVTPLDPVAVAQGWQYRLRRVGDVVDKEKLEVAVNGRSLSRIPDGGHGWPAAVETAGCRRTRSGEMGNRRTSGLVARRQSLGR